MTTYAMKVVLSNKVTSIPFHLRTFLNSRCAWLNHHIVSTVVPFVGGAYGLPVTVKHKTLFPPSFTIRNREYRGLSVPEEFGQNEKPKTIRKLILIPT